MWHVRTILSMHAHNIVSIWYPTMNPVFEYAAVRSSYKTIAMENNLILCINQGERLKEYIELISPGNGDNEINNQLFLIETCMTAS